MTEATGHEAKTIHRMLEISGGQSDDPELDAKFGRNEQNPLETDVVIVDEMSMVDTFFDACVFESCNCWNKIGFCWRR